MVSLLPLPHPDGAATRTVRPRAALLWCGRARGLSRWPQHVRKAEVWAYIIVACYTSAVSSLFAVFVPQACATAGESTSAVTATCTAVR